MQITPKEVHRIAALARLALSPEEVEQYAKQLNAILDAFQELSALDTRGVPAQSHAIALEMPLREDEVAPSLSLEDALKNAPAPHQGGFGVPKIVEK